MNSTAKSGLKKPLLVSLQDLAFLMLALENSRIANTASILTMYRKIFVSTQARGQLRARACKTKTVLLAGDL